MTRMNVLTRRASPLDFSQLFVPPTNGALVRVTHSRRATDTHLALRLPQQKNEMALKTAGVPRKTYTVGRNEDSGLRKIELPVGAPRFINARTLKAMLGGDRKAILFRKVGKRWDICPDAFKVDLTDRTQVFRMGEIQVYS